MVMGTRSFQQMLKVEPYFWQQPATHATFDHVHNNSDGDYDENKNDHRYNYIIVVVVL